MAKKPKFTLSTSKPKAATKIYKRDITQLEYKTALLIHSSSSKITEGCYDNLLTAICRKATIYRTVFTKTSQTEEQALATLKKWAKTLPFNKLA